MVKARAQLADGRHLLLLGLSEANLVRLKADLPIHIQIEELQLPAGEVIGAVALFYGKDETECFKKLEGLMDLQTRHEVRPREPKRPQ